VIGWRVLVGEGATCHIKVVTQCDFYEESLLTGGIVANKIMVDMATQVNGVTNNTCNNVNNNNCNSVGVNNNNNPVINNNNNSDGADEVADVTPPPLTAAQARPRRGEAYKHVAFAILIERDYNELQLLQDKLSAAIDGYSALTNEWTLVSNKASAARGEIVTLQGPQGEYTRICPKNTKEAEKTPEAATWRKLETLHISDLERNETIVEVHHSEAGD